MGTSLNETPGSERTHIVFLGRMNSGKSSLVNALAGQQVSIVSKVEGTTTDPVKKPMEIHGIGPCILHDTAGFDDESVLGTKRLERTKDAADGADLVVLVCTQEASAEEKRWLDYLRKKQIPVLLAVNKIDLIPNQEEEKIKEKIASELEIKPVLVSALTGEGIKELKDRLVELFDSKKIERYITGNLLQEQDLVLLVMPQDIQAPKGRLILPQVQTIRELLDKKCLTMCVTADGARRALELLKTPPKLVITDSQIFRQVYEIKPKESMLTSFSTLFAAYKGDIAYYVEGAKEIGQLTERDRVLIAECCTHAPLDEDIGRVKLPRLLRNRIGQGLSVDLVSGTDFPEDLSGYRLIIQCGACMFHRNYVMARVQKAKEQQVPMTNYGVAIAYLKGILDQVTIPDEGVFAVP